MSDTLQIFGKTFSNATGIVATDNTDTERTFIRPTGTMTIDENGTYDVSEYASAEVSVSGGGDEPIPDDGKTRIWIHIADGTPDNRLTFYLRFTASTANNTTVDWGDGVSETLGSTTATNYSHKYSQGGDYVITMTVNSGTISFIGDSTYRIYGANTTDNSYNSGRIHRVVFGNNVHVGDYTFYGANGLKSIVISNSITGFGTNMFNGCFGLASFENSASVTSIPERTFYQCRVLDNINIPNSVTSIGAYAFYCCYSLASLTIPENVTSISANAFSYAWGLSELHFKPTTPPNVANYNAFANFPSDCTIYVPQGCLSAYKNATNYGTVINNMQEEPT